MTNDAFNQIVKNVMNKCGNTLIKKGKEYSADNEDRLVNFKRGAGLTGETPEKVASDYMLKHIVSIYDLIERGITDEAIWDEKCGDAINYLILIRAIIAEKNEGKTLAVPEKPAVKTEPAK